MYQGSGVVVGINDVLTAKHVVYDSRHGGYAASITVIPAADTTPFDAPHGTFSDVREIKLRDLWSEFRSDGFLSAAESERDLALLGLATRIGDKTGWMDITSDYASVSARALGYPSSGTGLMAQDVFAQITAFAFDGSGKRSGPLLYSARDSFGSGGSGGPIVTIGKDGLGKVVGILSTGGPVLGYYASLASSGTWDWLLAAMRANDKLLPPQQTVTLMGTMTDDVHDLSALRIGEAGATLTDPGGSDTIKLGDLGQLITLMPGTIQLFGGGYLTISASTLIENLIGGSGNDQISGNNEGNRLSGGAGNDSFFLGSGRDYVDGGPGFDVVKFRQYTELVTVVQTGDSVYQVTDSVTGAVDQVTNVERLQMHDGGIALDTEGTAGQAFRLYQAALGRAPDAAGFGYQMRALDIGMSLTQMAKNFIASPEFAQTYGVLDNTAFVARLYQNVLHREGDAAGLSYHVGNLGRGVLRENVLAGFSESPENQAALIGVMRDGMTYTDGISR